MRTKARVIGSVAVTAAGLGAAAAPTFAVPVAAPAVVGTQLGAQVAGEAGVTGTWTNTDRPVAGFYIASLQLGSDGTYTMTYGIACMPGQACTMLVRAPEHGTWIDNVREGYDVVELSGGHVATVYGGAALTLDTEPPAYLQRA